MILYMGTLGGREMLLKLYEILFSFHIFVMLKKYCHVSSLKNFSYEDQSPIRKIRNFIKIASRSWYYTASKNSSVRFTKLFCKTTQWTGCSR